MSSDEPCRSVLVVDDELAMASAMRDILTAAGFRVTCVLDGALALQRIASGAYDVVVTDMFMPDIDGTQLLLEARRRGLRARLVAVSGGGIYSSSEEALKIAAKMGANAILEKPFTAAQLVAACAAANHG